MTCLSPSPSLEIHVGQSVAVLDMFCMYTIMMRAITIRYECTCHTSCSPTGDKISLFSIRPEVGVGEVDVLEEHAPELRDSCRTCS